MAKRKNRHPDYKDLGVHELRKLARKELGPCTFSSEARRHELEQALIKGKWENPRINKNKQRKLLNDIRRLQKKVHSFSSELDNLLNEIDNRP